jgi:parallel beta-helix repeat protein
MSAKFILLAALIVVSALVLTQRISCQFAKAEPKMWTVDDDGPADFATIIEAINAADSGDTIFVHNGTYAGVNEYSVGLMIGKPLTLIGECAEGTIIPQEVHICSPNVTLEGFTVNSGNMGVFIDEQSGITVSNNLICARGTDPSPIGIKFGSFNKIVNNTILDCSGISVFYSNDNLIFGNTMVGGWYGVFFGGSRNTIVANTIENMKYSDMACSGGGILISSIFPSDQNYIYGNNFINNEPQVYDFSWYNTNLPSSVNFWDNGYPFGGNYWSDYSGVDVCSGPYQNETGSDGIGDTPYVIDGVNLDRFPTMASIRTFDAGVWNEKQCSVQIASNSTISDFVIDKSGKAIIFNVTGENGFGFCRMVIPNIIAEEIWQGNYTIVTDGEPVEFRTWNDVENTYVYFTYQHSKHEIIIIPEFSTLIVVQAFIMATLVAVTIRRKRHRL